MTWAQDVPGRANAVFNDRVLRDLRKGAETRPGQWKLIKTYRTKKAAIPKHPTDVEVRNRYRSAGEGRQVTEVWARAIPRPATVENGPDQGHATGRKKPVRYEGGSR